MSTEPPMEPRLYAALRDVMAFFPPADDNSWADTDGIDMLATLRRARRLMREYEGRPK